MSTVVINGTTIHYEEQTGQEIGYAYADPSSRRSWQLRGSNSRDIILLAMATFLPAIDTVGGTPLFFERYDLREENTQIWTLRATYRKAPSQWTLSINTGGGTAKILQSRKTVRTYDCQQRGGSGSRLTAQNAPDDFDRDAATQTLLAVGYATSEINTILPEGVIPVTPENAIVTQPRQISNFSRAIGVTKDSVEGVDVVVPKFDISIDYKSKISVLPAAFIQAIYDNTGCINASPFTLVWKGQSMTFAAGDLLFTGAPGRQTSDDEVDLTFNFVAVKGLGGGAHVRTEYVQPVEDVSVNINVTNASVFDAGQYIYIVGAGYYLVESKHATEHWIVIRNENLDGNNAPPATVIPVDSVISADLNDHNPLMIGFSDPIKKRGHDYLWVRYEEQIDRTRNLVVRRPVSAYVEQVYPEGDFSQLALAVT